MNKLIRLYNQNRMQFWIIVIIIVFVFILIQLFNKWAKESVTKNIVTNETKEEYYEEGEAIISDKDVPEYNREEFGTLISNFLDYCISGNTNEAYNLLSNKCKELLYPNVEAFENLYCKKKFDTSKTYKFQSWTSEKTYIYQVKIFENSLYTGNASLDSYIEDYFNVVFEDGQAKLNISGYVTSEDINRTQQDNNISITIEEMNYFMEYCMVNIKVENLSEKEILLDTRENTDTIYLENTSGGKYVAFLNENSEDDLIIKPNSSKNISIKFNAKYSDYLKLETVNFTDIIENYQAYLNNSLLKSDRKSLKVEL